MWKNRLRYGIFIIIFGILLFFFDKPFLLYSVLILVAAGILDVLLIRKDAANVRMTIEVGQGMSVKEGIRIKAHISAAKRLWNIRSVQTDIEIRNEMFELVRHKSLLFHLEDQENEFEVPLDVEECGEIVISCQHVWARDLLGVSQIALAPFRTMHTILYPERANLQVELSRATIGIPHSEGMMQNRKGNDPSEMFDIREYVPGDDIRSIHWKLSGKTESLILRQASEPSHYNVVMLPDFGLEGLNDTVTPKEINGAVAAGIAVGEKLLRQNVSFCMAVPTENGLQVYEIQNEWDLRKMIPQWFHIAIQQNVGTGLRLFVTQHMEQHFTRLLILSAGGYRQNVSMLENRIGISILNISEGTENVYAVRSGNSEMVELPAETDSGRTYSLIC